VKRNVVEGFAYRGHDLIGEPIARNAPAAYLVDGEFADSRDGAQDDVAIGNVARRSTQTVPPGATEPMLTHATSP